MKSLLFILAGLFLSWHYTDLYSANSYHSLWAPLGVMVFAIALAIWLVIYAGFGRSADNDGGFGGGSGGDSGGFDGGCGGD